AWGCERAVVSARPGKRIQRAAWEQARVVAVLLAGAEILIYTTYAGTYRIPAEPAAERYGIFRSLFVFPRSRSAKNEQQKTLSRFILPKRGLWGGEASPRSPFAGHNAGGVAASVVASEQRILLEGRWPSKPPQYVCNQCVDYS
ncbi:MAG: hypothetical protein ABIV47_22375, partial [Roseiflexaceae bacterium]